ncbi:MAG: YbaB/EbfC family nucleoid-associated protein, partial [Terriglobia bacterium]
MKNLQQMQQIMKQVQQLQEQLQQQLDQLLVEASAGGGMVVVKMNGQKQIIAVQIDSDLFSSKDAEMLQDLIVAAVNEAGRKVDE